MRLLSSVNDLLSLQQSSLHTHARRTTAHPEELCRRRVAGNPLQRGRYCCLVVVEVAVMPRGRVVCRIIGVIVRRADPFGIFLVEERQHVRVIFYELLHPQDWKTVTEEGDARLILEGVGNQVQKGLVVDSPAVVVLLGLVVHGEQGKIFNGAGLDQRGVKGGQAAF